ncbi:MAG: 16S rRNA (uracil(1498)-N(3))-methyltransferase [Mycoplasmoidaceae bacterium]
MPKFKIYKILNNEIYLSDEDELHIKKSLRKKIGDKLFCFDSQNEYETIITSIDKLKLEIINKHKLENNTLNLNIYLGLIDKNNFELAVRKLNEINCKSITPVLFERSQKNIKLNYDRLNKIISESSKQCFRFTDLELNYPISFNELLNKIEKDKFNILAYQETKEIFSFDDIKYNDKINLIIGPEGGFSKKELDILEKYCFFLKLTKTILKSETAAIYLASILSFNIGSKNEK